MPNQITNTGILGRSYNSRGLITHNFDTKALVRQTNGTLWAAVRENHVGRYISLFRSTDDGFSWEKVWSDTFTTSSSRKVGIGGLNTNGPHITLQVYEDANRLILWHAYRDDSTLEFDIEPFVFDLDDPSERLDNDPIDYETVTKVALNADDMAVDVPYNQNACYISYVFFGDFRVIQYRPTYQSGAETSSVLDGSFYGIFGSTAHEDGYVDYVALANSGVGNTLLQHFRYDQRLGFGSKTTVTSFTGIIDATDVSLARDAYGTLFTVWSEANAAGTDVNVYYSASSTNGTSWTAPTLIPKSTGHSVYIDSITGQRTARTTVLGGLKGFIFSYVRNNSFGIPKTFVRDVLTEDGVTYTLGYERQIATNVTFDTDPVVGLRWFHPPGGHLLDISDPGLVRVAYQIGEGNSAVQSDSVPVRFGQELLRNTAYAESFENELGEYTLDPAGDNDLLVTVNVLGGPSENIDYYEAGLTGHVTDRYIAAFNTVGTEVRIFRFDPLTYAQMDDRSAFAAPVEYSVPIILDPQTYDFPLADKGTDNYESFIERDVRKVFLPPTFHLARNFVVNSGNFLKRTVWTIYFDGNEYELSQVVPYFLDGHIAYYSANAYVVGPSNNPFSRRTLPSET